MPITKAERKALAPRIEQSMLRWRKMDETARRLGRGLGADELVERVALEMSVSPCYVRDTLKGRKRPEGP
jgi:hypothetical protein